jgi:2-phosphosulfolactate phosphatase
VATAARRLAAAGGGHVHLVCAGTDGAVTAEDVLAAGAILAAGADAGDALDETARGAREAFGRVAAAADPRAALVAEFRRSPGGANLVALGMDADLPVCAALDALAVVPWLDAATGEMVPATESG